MIRQRSLKKVNLFPSGIKNYGGWSYKRLITLDPATPEADYQVKVELNTSNFDYSKAKADGGDLRFYQVDGTELNYWIEEWNTSATSTIWVKVVANNTDTIYMYYGNPSASSASDGDVTFEFFDDFEGTSLDTSKWSEYDSGGGYSVANSEITLSPIANTTNAVAIRTKSSFTNDVVVEAKVDPSSDTYYDLGLTTVTDVLTNTWHISQADNIGYAFLAQQVTSTSQGYYLFRRDSGSKTILTGLRGNSQTLQAIIYKLIYTNGGELKGYVFFLDGTEWTSLSATDTTYLNDAKYVVLWQGEYWNGAGGPSDWDRLLVRKYASPEPSATVGDESPV